MSFGSVIRTKRHAMGIGLNEFAERIDISAAYWSRVERDQEKPPSDAVIEKAAAVLGVPLDDLFVEANRLPPDMKRDIPRVVIAYGNAGSRPSFSSFSTGASAAEEAATVKWYNSEKGFGFVALADGRGDAFLHMSALRASGLQSVQEGAALQVRVSQGQKGLQVDQVVSVSEGSGMASPPRRPQPPRPDRNDRPRREVNLGDATEVAGIVKWYVSIRRAPQAL